MSFDTSRITAKMGLKASVLITSLLLLLTGCANQPKSNTAVIKNENPIRNSIYHSPCLQISLQNRHSNLKIGYGSGQSVTEAKQQALYDIANQIEVNVSGTDTSSTNKSSSNGSTQVSTIFSQQVKTRAQALLTSVEIVCSDTNDPSGSYHFALRYDQRPLAEIFADKLAQQLWPSRPGKIEWTGPSVIVNSPFIKTLEKNLVDKTNSQKLPLTLNLFRKDQQWQLAINKVIQIVKGEDFKQLFNWEHFNTSGVELLLQDEFGNTLSQHMREGDEFRFNIHVKQKGYLSVFDVYEDGRVTKIRENMPIHSKLRLPEHKGSFSAELLEPGQSTIDQYVFLVTNEPINSKVFHQLMLEDVSSNEHKNYYLNLFLFWLDKQDISASKMMQIETNPR